MPFVFKHLLSIIAAFLAALAITFLLGALLAAHAQSALSGLQPNCNSTKFFDTNVSGASLLASAPADGGLYVCSYAISSVGPVKANLASAATGTNCASPTQITPAWVFSPSTAAVGPLVISSSAFQGLFLPPATDLCVNLSAGISTQVQVFFYRTQGP
jgi:hypothetical protein